MRLKELLAETIAVTSGACLCLAADPADPSIWPRPIGEVSGQIHTLSDPADSAQPPAGMAAIPPGTIRGNDPDLGEYDLAVAAFCIDKYEVTKAKWDEIRAWGLRNGYRDLPAGGGKAANHPVHTVNWYDCVKWCNARSEMEDRTPCYRAGGSIYRKGDKTPSCDQSANGYRLPTAAEWEYAARGSLRDRRFPRGDTISHSEANFFGDKSYEYDGSETSGYHPTYKKGELPYTSPAGVFEANGYGLCDMAGNVREWCWDPVGSDRSVRGGSWILTARDARCGFRDRAAPDKGRTSTGFRAACSQDSPVRP